MYYAVKITLRVDNWFANWQSLEIKHKSDILILASQRMQKCTDGLALAECCCLCSSESGMVDVCLFIFWGDFFQKNKVAFFHQKFIFRRDSHRLIIKMSQTQILTHILSIN